jgi:hypothetical protein
MASDSRSRMESNRCSLLATPVELICTALSFLDVAELDLTRTLSLGLCQVPMLIKSFQLREVCATTI